MDEEQTGTHSQGHAVEFARQRLRSAVLEGQLLPGGLFTQAQLANLLNIGRTPLREAIRLLQEEGLFESDPNRTIRVAGLSRKELEDLYAVRIIHEAAAIRKTVPVLGNDDVGELRALVAKMDYLAEIQDYDRYGGPHREFHGLLVSGQGKRGAALSSQLFDHCERYRRAYVESQPRSYDLSASDHHEILDAALARDGVRCARALVRHYARTAVGVIEKLDPTAELSWLRFACAVAMAEPDFDAAKLLWGDLRA